MKRRRLLQTILSAPAAVAMPQAAPAQTPRAEEAPKLAVIAPDAAGDGVPRFFSAGEFAAFRRLGQLLMPFAEETGAAAFLDLLTSQSAAEKQSLYRDGVARLDSEARRLHGKTFAELRAEQAAPILTPLGEAWTYAGPADPFARFLRTAKEEFWQATVNSREWAQAMASRSRGASGTNYYWHVID